MENRSTVKMLYKMVISALSSQNAYKGNAYTANEYRTKHYKGNGKNRTSRAKKKFHRQKK